MKRDIGGDVLGRDQREIVTESHTVGARVRNRHVDPPTRRATAGVEYLGALAANPGDTIGFGGDDGLSAAAEADVLGRCRPSSDSAAESCIQRALRSLRSSPSVLRSAEH